MAYAAVARPVKPARSVGRYMRIVRAPRVAVTDLPEARGLAVLDIGSGPGRFVPLFQGARLYVAVEPYGPFADEIERRLSAMVESHEVYRDLWENVKPSLLMRRWDVVIFWNSLMFMKPPKGVDPVEYGKELVDEVIDSIKPGGLLLFSVYEAKTGYYTLDQLKQIYQHVLHHPCLEVLKKKRAGHSWHVIARKKTSCAAG